MVSWLRSLFADRPTWMNVLMVFCGYMAFVYLPWDFFVKPVAVDEEVAAKLAMPVESLDLTVRSNNCLVSNHVETVEQLVSMTEADLLKIRSFGKTSLREIHRKLADMGLSLGMTDLE